MSNVIYLHGQPTPVTRFLRVTEHRRLDQLLEADKLPYERFVVEAGYLREQRVLIDALRQRGHQLVLDTNIAELSAVAKFAGHVKHAPWANPDGILTEEHLADEAGAAIMHAIARLAVANGFARVHAPSHFVQSASDAWLPIDVENCVALRRALDTEGGKDIAIDYPLMISNTLLNDGAQRRDLIVKLGSLPIDSIWSRVSGFGSDATAAGLKKYISAVRDFHSLGKPIVADGVGGLSALAIVAFGAACGLSHGVAAKERFDASSWYKPPKPGSGGGGSGHFVLLPGIDRLLTREDAEGVINASGGRRLASCNDRMCCPRGFEDTIKDAKGHFLRQRAMQCDAISAVPEPVRPGHFLDKDLTEADRRARLLAKLKLSDKLSSLVVENAKRVDRFRDVLGNLEKTSASATRSPGFPSAAANREAGKDRR